MESTQDGGNATKTDGAHTFTLDADDCLVHRSSRPERYLRTAIPVLACHSQSATDQVGMAATF
jgi:hypothetical protein